jgi:hypothetical protein
LCQVAMKGIKLSFFPYSSHLRARRRRRLRCRCTCGCCCGCKCIIFSPLTETITVWQYVNVLLLRLFFALLPSSYVQVRMEVSFKSVLEEEAWPAAGRLKNPRERERGRRRQRRSLHASCVCMRMRMLFWLGFTLHFVVVAVHVWCCWVVLISVILRSLL